MTILVFGGNGQVGRELLRALAPLGTVVATTRSGTLSTRRPLRTANTSRSASSLHGWPASGRGTSTGHQCRASGSRLSSPLPRSSANCSASAPTVIAMSDGSSL